MDSSIARQRISSVVKPDSITTSEGDFLATHVALRKLHLLTRFELKPTGGKDYTEEEIYQKLVLNPDNKHQFIAVYGQSGTGKSHLIRWFEAKYRYDKPDNEVVLFIRRNDNTLKGTIRQLLNTPEVKDLANKDIYDRLVRVTDYEEEEKLKGRIYYDLLNEIEHDDGTHDIQLSNIKRKRLRSFLSNEIVQDHLKESDGPIERIYSKVAENTLVDRDVTAQFKPDDLIVTADLFDGMTDGGAERNALKLARELMSDEEGFSEAKKLALYLNQFINGTIQRCAGIAPGDFRDIFQDIRKELYREGKNLTLFIEDVTSFTGVDDSLLDALIVEHTGMNTDERLCRISSVIGTTSNYLENNFRDNHKDRITQYIYIPSNIFDENGVFEFVGRYLNTMSLPEDQISTWVENHASNSDYPVHEIKEGASWDCVQIDGQKKLSLYPFNKNSIRNLYKYTLSQGHQTPRYIIRDMIEPIVNDILKNKENFPSSSLKFNISSIPKDGVLINAINKIEDKDLKERTMNFMSIWGDGSLDQYINENGQIYISSINTGILEELNLPVLINEQELVAKESPNSEPDMNNKSGPSPEPHTISIQEDEISLETKIRYEKALKLLNDWVNGHSIDISATGGTSGILQKVQGNICNYLWSSINWQAEGLSEDNISKIKKSNVKLITFENQLKVKNEGFYVMPADWESFEIIAAFLRWQEYGSQSWNYPESDMDAYLITSWSSKIQKNLIKAVNERGLSNLSYIEAALIAEIYRMILVGEFNKKSLDKLTIEDFLNSKSGRKSNQHVKEWNSLIELIRQKGAEDINKKTIRKYFNIPQGDGGSVIVLDPLEFERLIKRAKSDVLTISSIDLESTDPVKLRRNVFLYLKEILDRVEPIAEAERARARDIYHIIQSHFDPDETDEDNIDDLIERIQDFYGEINNTRISVRFYDFDSVKKSRKRITRAIEVIREAVNIEDSLKILIAFSKDPIGDLLPLMNLYKQLEEDIKKVDEQLAQRKSKLGKLKNSETGETRYRNELQMIDDCIGLLGLEAA